jgi:hypothetical protein
MLAKLLWLIFLFSQNLKKMFMKSVTLLAPLSCRKELNEYVSRLLAAYA